MTDELRVQTDIEEMRARRQKRTDAAETFKGVFEQRQEVIAAEENVTEERGLIMDTVLGLARAIPGAFEETFDLIASLDEEMGRKYGKLDFSITDGDGIGFDPFIEGEDESPFRAPERGFGLILDSMGEPERFTGMLAEPIGKFVIGFLTGKKILTAAGIVATTTAGSIGVAAAAGALADAAVFDGHEQRLSDLIQSVPALRNPITEWLASDEEDTELEGRIKSVIEGAGFGVLIDSVMLGIRGIRAWRRNTAINKAVKEAEDHEFPAPKTGFDALTIDRDGNSILITAPRSTARATVKDAPVHEGTPSAGTLGDTEAGKIELIDRGEKLQVINAEVQEESLRAGNGKKLYDAARKLADDEGKILVSDTSVSDSAARVWESMKRDGDTIIDQRITDPDNIETIVKDGKTQYQTRNGTPVFERTPKPKKEIPNEPSRQTQKEAGTQTPEEVILERKSNLKARLKETMQITDDQARAFRKAMEDGDEDAASAVMADFNENTIDWSQIEDADDIKQVLLMTEKIFADLIDAAKGGVQSNKQTKMLANLVSATPKEIKNLFRGLTEGGGIAARFYAAQRTMYASAAEVKRAAKASLDHPGSSKHEAAALRALQVHAAIQAEVKGAQTEIARALQGMSIIKNEAATNFREFDEIRRQLSVKGGGKTAWEKQMDLLLADMPLNALNAHVSMTPWSKFKNMFIEYTINSMLSSPKTHVINFVSNVLNTVLYSLDRGLGGSFRYMVKGDKQALREFRIDVYDKFTRMDEAWKLAKQAWRDGAPVTDKRQRIEFQTRKALSVEGTSREATAADEGLRELDSPILARKTEVVRDDLGNITRAIDHTVYERVINTLGRVVRVPGRALITGDEFFKAVNRNAEISVLAFRQADDEALAKGLNYGTDAYEKFLSKRIKKLSDVSNRDVENIKIQVAAVQKSRRTTFQEAPISATGANAERFINSNRFMKLVIAPFFRTPMNIIRQGAFDRTPLGYMFKANRDIIKHGHARDAAEIQARMFTGVAAMATFYGLVGDADSDSAVKVVGKVPIGTSSKDANIKDYSISFGDSPYHQFNRLEPMGMWMGVIADLKTAAMFSDDEDRIVALAQGAVGAFMNNVGSKTYMTSLTDLQDMLEGVSSSKPATVERAMDRFLSGQFGKLVPQIVKSGAAALEGEDRFAKETWGVLDTIANRSSLFNENLPDQHDNLGRLIPRDGGLSIMFNPFSTSETSDDPVDKEMFRLGFTLAKMPKTIGGGAVQLTDVEYSRLTGLMAKTGIHATLTTLVTSDAWEGLTDPLKKSLMKQQISAARAVAHRMFLATGDIIQRLTAEKISSAMMLTPDQE